MCVSCVGKMKIIHKIKKVDAPFLFTYQFLFLVPWKKLRVLFTFQFFCEKAEGNSGKSAWPSQFVTDIRCLCATSIFPGSRSRSEKYPSSSETVGKKKNKEIA